MKEILYRALSFSTPLQWNVKRTNLALECT